VTEDCDDGCCFHETQRTTSSFGAKLVMLTCCYCARPVTERYETKSDPAHGRYAPKIWVKVQP
jgi:hypothetical protein